MDCKEYCWIIRGKMEKLAGKRKVCVDRNSLLVIDLGFDQPELAELIMFSEETTGNINHTVDTEVIVKDQMSVCQFVRNFCPGYKSPQPSLIY